MFGQWMRSARLITGNRCVRQIASKQLIYNEYGNPPDKLRLTTVQLAKPASTELLVRWLGAPVNPADINQVQGVYPIRPPLPAVGGIEGFGQVEEVGSDVKKLKTGDWVVPAQSAVGCWRQYGNHSQMDLLKIDNRLPFELAATFQVNPPTAYCMLKNFVHLKHGDLVVQNGANSAVGQAVIQMCKAWGVRSVNFVRKRENLAELVEQLKSLGATEVFTEDEMKQESKNRAKNAQLALNCVGGTSAKYLANCLAPKGVMVTYGGMSRKHSEIPAGPLIFKDISLVGFWVSKWYLTEGLEKERQRVFDEIAELMRQGKLRAPKTETHKIDDWRSAIENTMNSSGAKQLLEMH